MGEHNRIQHCRQATTAVALCSCSWASERAMVHSTAKGKGKRPGRGGSSGRKRSNGVPSKGRMPTVKEVVFDDDARREYLTGFSKRKKEKKDAAKERALAKGREEKLEMRKQIRDARKEQAAANIAQAREYYGDDAEDGALEAGASGSAEDDDDDDEPQEQAFENDEMTSRVVIQDMRLSDDENDAPAAVEAEQEEDDDDEEVDMDSASANMFALIAPSRVKAKAQKEKEADGKAKKRFTAASARSIVDDDSSASKAPTFATPNDSPQKKPAKRFTYETKAARRAESAKQKVRRMEKAEGSRSRSGGKTGRGGKAGVKRKSGK